MTEKEKEYRRLLRYFGALAKYLRLEFGELKRKSLAGIAQECIDAVCSLDGVKASCYYNLRVIKFEDLIALTWKLKHTKTDLPQDLRKMVEELHKTACDLHYGTFLDLFAGKVRKQSK